MSFDPVNMPMQYAYGMGQQQWGPQQPMAPYYNQPVPQQQPVDIKVPNLVTSSKDASMPTFTVIDSPSSTTSNIAVPVVKDDSGAKKKRGRPKKEDSNSLVVSASSSPDTTDNTATVGAAPAIYNYYETTGMLYDTLNQIDTLNSALLQEFESVRHNRTMKNKYNTLVGLSENIGALIGNRINVLKEINSTITKSGDLDYKREKDNRAAMASLNDDKYVADMYKAFLQNTNNMNSDMPYPSVDPSIFGSGIIRAELPSTGQNNGGIADAQYLNYLSNLSPEQNLMRYEGNPNVKQVVVFDAATGSRMFQMMDMSTGTVIPNVPVYDQMFMEDTTLDLKNKIAKNINLNETFPIVVINEGVTSEY